MSYMKNLSMNFVVINKYLDFNNYTTPIQSYFDDRYSFLLTPSFSKVSRVYLQKNEAILNDDYLGIQPASNYTFFNVEKSTTDIAYVGYEYVGFGLMLGPSKITYTRNVFTLMQLIGNVGGVYGLLISI